MWTSGVVAALSRPAATVATMQRPVSLIALWNFVLCYESAPVISGIAVRRGSAAIRLATEVRTAEGFTSSSACQCAELLQLLPPHIRLHIRHLAAQEVFHDVPNSSANHV